jgi:hypothetical protein
MNCDIANFLYNTKQYLETETKLIYTGLFKMIVRVLTACHTQYT